MNTIIKYLAIGATIVTAWAGLLPSNANHNPSPQYEVTRGRITNVEKREITEKEDRVYFDLEYITGEKRSCSRVVFEDQHMYGDSGIIASPNYRDANNPLPTGFIDICCWGGGRMMGRCSVPGDSQYAGCLSEAYKQGN